MPHPHTLPPRPEPSTVLLTLSSRAFLRHARTHARTTYSCTATHSTLPSQVLDKDLAETLWLLSVKCALPPPPPPAGAHQLAKCAAHLEEVAVLSEDALQRMMAGEALRVLPELEASARGERVVRRGWWGGGGGCARPAAMGGHAHRGCHGVCSPARINPCCQPVHP